MVAEILEQLADDANALLADASGQSFVLPPSLVPFTVTALGNFPFYWQNPSNLKFNHLTYDWISSNLRAGFAPVQLDGSFTNYFIQALGAITYQLSTADLNALSLAKQNAVNQQFAMLSAWQAAYGSIPNATPTQQPIDIIINTIATTWATPPTTWTAMQSSTNIAALLNSAPASGQTILPVLQQYLNALGSSVSLQNAVSMNNGLVQQALAALQNPSVANGGISADNNFLYPAFAVLTPLADILSGLNNSANTITLSMTVTANSPNGYTVSINNNASVNVAASDFFQLFVANNADFFNSLLQNGSAPVQLEMTFPGVVQVNFTPVSFDQSTGQNWFWTTPITEAMKNGTSDVSGFKFAPNPQIDFSAKGPFGFLNAVAISNYPSVKITATNPNPQSVAKTFQSQNVLNPIFMGVPLNASNQKPYSASTQIDNTNSTIIFTLSPPPASAQSLTSVGWVLGVQPVFPAA